LKLVHRKFGNWRFWRHVAGLTPVAIAGALWTACAVPPPREPISRIVLPSEIRVRVAGKVLDVPIEDYVLGSALAEVAPVGESAATITRTFEVQAVLARSYAASHLGRHATEGFDLCDGTHCQLYEPGRLRTSRFADAARAAVQHTAGLVIVYGQRVVEALYHADCGGYTSAAEDVWGSPLPYLLSTPDILPSGTHRSWKIALPIAQLRSALNADPRSRVGQRLIRVAIPRHDIGGRAIEIEIRGDENHVLRGEEFRTIVNQRLADKGLQSTRFDIHASSGSYVFEGTGWGHGVGLCQLGALSRARKGQTLESIIQTYFSGATVARVNTD
jgi:stage II sporulation protein D (peptidoglycan lytic transglycosylase)